MNMEAKKISSDLKKKSSDSHQNSNIIFLLTLKEQFSTSYIKKKKEQTQNPQDS